MKYLIRNSSTNVIEMLFETPITPSAGLEVISIPDEQFRTPMLRSIFIDVNRYKPYPSQDPNEQYWVSDGTNWIDPRTDDEVWDEARRLRDEELAETDWTQLADADLNPAEQTAWANYRANIRNAVSSAPVNDPRSAEAIIRTERNDNKPDRGNNDPRRGRGRGRSAESRRN